MLKDCDTSCSQQIELCGKAMVDCLIVVLARARAWSGTLADSSHG